MLQEGKVPRSKDLVAVMLACLENFSDLTPASTEILPYLTEFAATEVGSYMVFVICGS